MKDTIHPVDIDSGLADQRASIVAAVAAQEVLEDTLAQEATAALARIVKVSGARVDPRVPMAVDAEKRLLLGLGMTDGICLSPNGKPGEYNAEMAKRVAGNEFRIVGILGSLSIARGEPAVVGRADRPEWGLPPSISRRHVLLTRIDPGQIMVQDLGSTNGTFLYPEVAPRSLYR